MELSKSQDDLYGTGALKRPDCKIRIKFVEFIQSGLLKAMVTKITDGGTDDTRTQIR